MRGFCERQRDLAQMLQWNEMRERKRERIGAPASERGGAGELRESKRERQCENVTERAPTSPPNSSVGVVSMCHIEIGHSTYLYCTQDYKDENF